MLDDITTVFYVLKRIKDDPSIKKWGDLRIESLDVHKLEQNITKEEIKEMRKFLRDKVPHIYFAEFGKPLKGVKHKRIVTVGDWLETTQYDFDHDPILKYLKRDRWVIDEDDWLFDLNAPPRDENEWEVKFVLNQKQKFKKK